VIFADPSAEMVPAVTVKFAEVEPADMVIVAGTGNTAALLDRLTIAPPVNAAFESVSEQVAVPPEIRLVGEQETELTVGLVSREIDEFAELPL